MKKRIISLLLAVITVMQIVPWTMLPIIAEDGISVEDMEVGKLYRARLKTKAESGWDDVMPYKDATSGEAYDSYILKTTLPNELTVKLMNEGDKRLYVTNTEWKGAPDVFSSPVDLNEYRYIDATELIILEKIEEEPEPDDGYIYEKVDIFCDESEGGVVTLQTGGKVYAFTKFDSEISKESAKYQWQIKLEDGRWATIGDYIYPYAVLSEALLVNNPSSTGRATLRCIVTDGSKKYASDEIALQMATKDNAAEQLSSMNVDSYNAIAPMQKLAADEGDGEDEGAFQVTINYVFARVNEDGTHENATVPFIQSLHGSQVCNGVFDSPFIVGYTACVPTDDPTNSAVIKFDSNGDGKDEYYLPQPSWKFKNVGLSSPAEERNITIYYVPQKTNFIVEHYYQNLQDDGYSLAGMDVIKTKYSDDPVGEGLARNAYGYTPLFYDATTKVAGNGNTVVEIYYDRIYYLVDFDLADGYGLMPYYVRYETQVMLTEPTRPGYSFVNPWQLDRVYTKDEDTKVETNLSTDDPNISAAYKNKNANTLITVEHNLHYTANWKAETASYTVIYWVENANDDAFSVAGYTEVTGAAPGSKVNAQDNIPTSVLNSIGAQKAGLVYIDAISDKNIEVKGDGTSSVNVYYKRKLSTLNFWANALCTLELHTHNATCQATCTLDAHTHSEECGVASQTCGKEEHKHTVECCTLQEHTHSSDCCTVAVHTQHDATCCTKEVHPQHDRSCCTKEEHTHQFYCDWIGCTREEHTHGTNCSCPKSIHTHGDGLCSCDKTHDHTSNCSCDIAAHFHGDGLCNGEKCGKEQHSHTISCYTYKCGKDEHLHTGACFRGCTQVEHTAHNNTCNSNSGYSVVHAAMVKYGADTTSIWNGAPVYRWLLSQNSTRAYTTSPTMPAENLNTYGQDLNGATNKYTIHFYERGTTNKIREDTIYYRSGGSSLGDEDYIDIPGFTFYDGDTDDTNGEFVVEYTRNSYNITFNDGEKEVYSKTSLYESDISNVVNEFTLEIPSSKEDGSVKFVGWYTTPTCADGTEFDFAGQKMPINGVHLFAKWEPTTHNVKVYRQESEIGSTVTGELLLDKTVEFGTQIQESDLADHVKPNANYVFGGWFYKDENGEENRYDFNTMVVKHSYVIYAKWTKNVPIPYTVKYVTKDSEGNTIEIAKADSGIALEGVKKTFTAKSGTDLNAPYHEWYFPHDRCITFEMKANEAENVIEFEYETATEIQYTISHVFKDEDFKTYLGGSDTFIYNTVFTIKRGDPGENGQFKAIITEKFNDLVKEEAIKAEANKQNATDANEVWDIVRGLTPNYYTQELHLVKDPSKNVMTFNWEDAGATTMYQIVHYVQDKGSNTYSIFHTEGHIVQNAADTKITAKWREIYGFKRVAFKINGVTQNVDLTKDDIETTLGSNVSTSGKILELYYDREIYDYTVHHYVIGTTNNIPGYDDETFQAYFEEEIQTSRFEKDVQGYVYYKDNVPSHTIGTNNYEITVFYSPVQVTFRYQEAIAGRGYLSRLEDYKGLVGMEPEDEAACTATAKDGYRFVGWFLDAGATQAVVSGTLATLSDDGATILPITPTPEMANQTITFYALFEPTTRVFKNIGVADASQAFVYHIKGNGAGNANVDVTFVITGNGEITLAMLPYGDYTITVESWAWRYGLPNGQATNSWTVTINTTDPFVFDYSEDTPDNQWLTDDAIGIISPIQNS